LNISYLRAGNRGVPQGVKGKNTGRSNESEAPRLL